MIHSLAGGELKDSQIIDIAKLEFLESQGKFFWYLLDDKNIKKGDIVLAPFGFIDELCKARVISVSRNVDSKNFPISIKKLKKICKKA